MPDRQRVAITLSLPPDTAKEYRKIAKAKGESGSQLFREMFDLYKKQKLRDEFAELQRYGAGKARKLNITEKEIEKLGRRKDSRSDSSDFGDSRAQRSESP